MDNTTESLSPDTPQEQKTSRSYTWMIILSVIACIMAIVGYGAYSLMSVSEKVATSAISELSNIVKVAINTPTRPGITEMALAGDTPTASITKKSETKPIENTGARENSAPPARLLPVGAGG